MPILNPYVLIGVAIALALAGASGFRLGVDHVEARLYAEQKALQKEADTRQVIIDTLAIVVRKEQRQADETALKLNQEIRRAKDKLAVCDGRGTARLSGEFIRLHDLALQTAREDRPEPTGAAGGAADHADLLELETENGRRWKGCRDRLNALIKAVK